MNWRPQSKFLLQNGRNKQNKDLSHIEQGQFTFISGTSNHHLLYNREPQYNKVSFPGSLGVGPGSKKPVGGTVILNLCPGTHHSLIFPQAVTGQKFSKQPRDRHAADVPGVYNN